MFLAWRTECSKAQQGGVLKEGEGLSVAGYETEKRRGGRGASGALHFYTEGNWKGWKRLSLPHMD